VPIYDRYLAARLQASDADLPETVALVITERDLPESGAYDTLEQFLDLAFQFGTEKVVVYVSVLDEGAVPTLRRELERVRAPGEVAVRGPDDDEQVDAPVQISIGLGGKHEFATAVKGLAEEAKAGDLDPADIDEDDVDRRLVFPTAPRPGHQDRRRTALRFHDLAVSLLGTVLHRRELAELPRTGLLARVAGLPGQTAQVWALN